MYVSSLSLTLALNQGRRSSDVQGFEIGSGFSGAAMLGSEHNDEFYMEGGAVRTRTNRSGGVQGGISNGELAS